MIITYKNNRIKQLMLFGKGEELRTSKQRKDFLKLISPFNSIALASDNLATMRCFKCLSIEKNGENGSISLSVKSMSFELEFKSRGNDNQIEITKLKINTYENGQKSNRKDVGTYASRKYCKTGT